MQVKLGTIEETNAKHIAVSLTNLQGKYQSYVVIDPTTKASMEQTHIIKVPTRAFCKKCLQMKSDEYHKD